MSMNFKKYAAGLLAGVSIATPALACDEGCGIQQPRHQSSTNFWNQTNVDASSSSVSKSSSVSSAVTGASTSSAVSGGSSVTTTNEAANYNPLAWGMVGAALLTGGPAANPVGTPNLPGLWQENPCTTITANGNGSKSFKLAFYSDAVNNTESKRDVNVVCYAAQMQHSKDVKVLEAQTETVKVVIPTVDMGCMTRQMAALTGLHQTKEVITTEVIKEGEGENAVVKSVEKKVVRELTSDEIESKAKQLCAAPVAAPAPAAVSVSSAPKAPKKVIKKSPCGAKGSKVGYTLVCGA